MYQIAICDDDAAFSAAFRDQLSDLLNEKGVSFHLSLFSDPSSLLRSIENNIKYDLLFLDIIFDTEQGLHVANLLRKRKENTDIVFVSSSSDYALDSYDTAPLHYLTKPVDAAKLLAALNRFWDRNSPRLLQLTTSKGLLRILIPEILFFEIYGHKIVIHKSDGTQETCTGTLKELEALLPPLVFVRPHRSYLVNLDHISKISRYQIRLSSGDTIPISKNLYQKTQISFIDYADKRCISF